MQQRIITSACLSVFLFSSLAAFSQNDSLRAIARYNKVLGQMDSVIVKWKERNVNDVAGFVLFGYSQNSACIVWKDMQELKGGKITFLNGKPLIREVKLSKARKLLLSRCLDNVCDLKSSFQNVKKVKIDHDIPMYLKMMHGAGKQELFFLYSAYLGAKEETCGLIIKELMWLSQ